MYVLDYLISYYVQLYLLLFNETSSIIFISRTGREDYINLLISFPSSLQSNVRKTGLKKSLLSSSKESNSSPDRKKLKETQFIEETLRRLVVALVNVDGGKKSPTIVKSIFAVKEERHGQLNFNDKTLHNKKTYRQY